MREIIFKYTLKSKIDNDTITVYAPLYNEKNGTMQFPIELDKWEVLNIQQCLDTKDINNHYICEGDTIRFKSHLYKDMSFTGIIKWSHITNGFYIDNINMPFNSGYDIYNIELIEEI